MAVTATPYNHTAKLLLNGQVSIANLKLMLLSGYTLDVTETALTALTAAEVSGNGWAAGGVAFTGEAVTTVTTNDAMYDADDISVTASGGAIGPATAAALVDSTNGKPLIHYDFGATKQADDGTPFKFTVNASGLITGIFT